MKILRSLNIPAQIGGMEKSFLCFVSCSYLPLCGMEVALEKYLHVVYSLGAYLKLLLSIFFFFFFKFLHSTTNVKDMDWREDLLFLGNVLLMSWHLPWGSPWGLLTSITHRHRLVNLIILSPISLGLTFCHGNDGRVFIFTLQTW